MIESLYVLAALLLASLVVFGFLIGSGIERRFSTSLFWFCVALIVCFGATALDFLTSPGVNAKSLGLEGHLWGPAIWVKRFALLSLLVMTLVKCVGGVVRGVTRFDIIFAGFLLFWITNYALNAVGGSSHDFLATSLYMLPLVFAIYSDGEDAFRGFARGAIFSLTIVMFGSLVAIPIASNYVVTKSMTTLIGALGGRLNGLTGHPNTLSQISLLVLALLMFEPGLVKRLWMKIGIVALSLAVMVLAQSKTAIGVLIVVGGLWAAFRTVRNFDPVNGRGQMTGVVSISMVVIALVLTLQVAGVFEHVIAKLEAKIPALTTLTGRTEIWRLTFAEYLRNPLFGYGPGLWDLEFRFNNGLLEVGQAHNQLLQTIGSSGIFGVIGLFAYFGTLVQGASRALRQQGRWLPLALLSMMLIMSVSEAPFRLSHPMDVGALLQICLLLCLRQCRLQRDMAVSSGNRS